jgi:hypothetical protein
MTDQALLLSHIDEVGGMFPGLSALRGSRTSRVAAFVRSVVGREKEPEWLTSRLKPTLNAGLAECDAGYGDTVVILPGHTESISTADQMSNLVADVNIVGWGYGAQRPTFTWTTSASTFLFDQDGVHLSNCILNMEPGTGTVTVAAPITVTGNGCGIHNCLCRTSTDADNKTTLPFTLTSPDDFEFTHNHVYGATAGECTALMDINAAHRLVMIGNFFEAATAATTNGVVRFVTAASLNIYLEKNVYINRKALSDSCVTGLAAVSGVSIEESFNYLDTSSMTGWKTSTGIMHFFNPRVTNTAGETGSVAVGTTSA